MDVHRDEEDENEEVEHSPEEDSEEESTQVKRKVSFCQHEQHEVEEAREKWELCRYGNLREDIESDVKNFANLQVDPTDLERQFDQMWTRIVRSIRGTTAFEDCWVLDKELMRGHGIRCHSNTKPEISYLHYDNPTSGWTVRWLNVIKVLYGYAFDCYYIPGPHYHRKYCPTKDCISPLHYVRYLRLEGQTRQEIDGLGPPEDELEEDTETDIFGSEEMNVLEEETKTILEDTTQEEEPEGDKEKKRPRKKPIILDDDTTQEEEPEGDKEKKRPKKKPVILDDDTTSDREKIEKKSKKLRKKKLRKRANITFLNYDPDSSEEE